MSAADFECWMGVQMQAGGRPTVTRQSKTVAYYYSSDYGIPAKLKVMPRV